MSKVWEDNWKWVADAKAKRPDAQWVQELKTLADMRRLVDGFTVGDALFGLSAIHRGRWNKDPKVLDALQVARQALRALSDAIYASEYRKRRSR